MLELQVCYLREQDTDQNIIFK